MFHAQPTNYRQLFYQFRPPTIINSNNVNNNCDFDLDVNVSVINGPFFLSDLSNNENNNCDSGHTNVNHINVNLTSDPQVCGNDNNSDNFFL